MMLKRVPWDWQFIWMNFGLCTLRLWYVFNFKLLLFHSFFWFLTLFWLDIWFVIFFAVWVKLGLGGKGSFLMMIQIVDIWRLIYELTIYWAVVWNWNWIKKALLRILIEKLRQKLPLHLFNGRLKDWIERRVWKIKWVILYSACWIISRIRDIIAIVMYINPVIYRMSLPIVRIHQNNKIVWLLIIILTIKTIHLLSINDIWKSINNIWSPFHFQPPHRTNSTQIKPKTDNITSMKLIQQIFTHFQR